jgi:hypothetical protein
MRMLEYQSYEEAREKFTLAATESGNPLDSVVHTRTIVDPILGFKLNGKVGPKDTIASIYAVDELAPESAEDYAHVTIARYKHALSGDSFIGGVWETNFSMKILRTGISRSSVPAPKSSSMTTGTSSPSPIPTSPPFHRRLTRG